MTAAAVAAPRVVSRTRAADLFFFATFFCVTFEKVHWNVAGTVGIADVLTILFLAAFTLESRGPSPRTTEIVVLFFVAFVLVYLLGFYNLETRQALDQWVKGMVKFALHFVFLACAASARGSRARTRRGTRS